MAGFNDIGPGCKSKRHAFADQKGRSEMFFGILLRKSPRAPTCGSRVGILWRSSKGARCAPLHKILLKMKGKPDTGRRYCSTGFEVDRTVTIRSLPMRLRFSQ